MTLRFASFATTIAFAAAPAFATAVAAPAPASRPAAPAAAPTQQPPTRAQLIKNLSAQFKAIDTNGNGVLEANELAAAELKNQQQRVAAIRARMENEFAKLDTNRDGLLSRTEFMAAAPQPPTTAPDVTAAFNAFDKNHDGKVTAAEFQAGQLARFDKMDTKHAGVLTLPGSPPRTLTRADFLKQVDGQFKAIDAAGHGFFTKPEFAAAELKARQQRVVAARTRMDTEFTKLDTSKDGQLSKPEFLTAAPAAPTTAPNPANLVAQLDKNHDGKITLDEYLAPILARFDSIDTNHNGVIDPAERQAAQANAARKR